MTLVLAAAFGLAWGSFAAAASDRLPSRRSLLASSQCDGCGKRLAPRRLIPVASYAWLRGYAACCGARISPRSTLSELLCAAWFAAAFAFGGGVAGIALALAGAALLFAVLTISAFGGQHGRA